VNVLLDTHVLIWWLQGNSRLADVAVRTISDAKNRIVVSAVTAWEIEVKVGLGKLRIDEDWQEEVFRQRFERLSISFRHTRELRELPSLHRDPFDRMLIAQARVEGLGLMTADEQIMRYPVSTICVA